MASYNEPSTDLDFCGCGLQNLFGTSGRPIFCYILFNFLFVLNHIRTLYWFWFLGCMCNLNGIAVFLFTNRKTAVLSSANQQNEILVGRQMFRSRGFSCYFLVQISESSLS